jgi:hypothetical protein
MASFIIVPSSFHKSGILKQEKAVSLIDPRPFPYHANKKTVGLKKGAHGSVILRDHAIAGGLTP